MMSDNKNPNVCASDVTYPRIVGESRTLRDSKFDVINLQSFPYNHPSNTTERDCCGGPGVVVWGGIMLNSRTELHAFDKGSVTGERDFK
ncbi:hypothetical protein TNCV_4238051 [Trichonephila clavipes]|nr:hypothetical protein TNCV_4238051 [Trichonephila clavipes]